MHPGGLCRKRMSFFKHNWSRDQQEPLAGLFTQPQLFLCKSNVNQSAINRQFLRAFFLSFALSLNKKLNTDIRQYRLISIFLIDNQSDNSVF